MGEFAWQMRQMQQELLEESDKSHKTQAARKNDQQQLDRLLDKAMSLEELLRQHEASDWPGQVGARRSSSCLLLSTCLGLAHESHSTTSFGRRARTPPVATLCR